MHEALLQIREGDKVRCSLCPHLCRIAEDGVGICGARGVVDGSLKALTYGLVSSCAADPIEKKPVFHYQPGTRVLSFGSIGCNLRCLHCQNWEISRSREVRELPGTSVIEPAEVPALARRAGCQGVAFTYNEPVIWPEWVLDAARAARKAGLYTVMVTNGYVTSAGLDLFAETIDVWRVDIKAFSDDVFRMLCRAPHPEAVLRGAERAKREFGLHVECVTNVVPTINDSEEELGAIARWIATSLGNATPWHVTRFHPSLELAHLLPTPLATLERAREIGVEEGLRFVYLGNVDVPGAEDTYCPSCGAIAVSRNRFEVCSCELDAQGACLACSTPLGIVPSR